MEQTDSNYSLMHAASRQRPLEQVLQGALQEEAQQLDFQLAGLCRPKAPDAAASRQNAQIALNHVLALARFFPAIHQVQDIVRKLELVCQPLLAASPPLSRRRLLAFCIRLLQSLQPAPRSCLMLCLLQQIHALAETVQVNTDAVLAENLRRLTLLQTFLGFSTQPADDAERHEAFPERQSTSVHIQIFRWQYRLQAALQAAQSSGHALAEECLQCFRQQQVEMIGRLCLHSDWSLGYFCTSGLALLFQRSRQLALACEDSGSSQVLPALAGDFLELHLRGNVPDTLELHKLLRCLFEISRHRNRREDDVALHFTPEAAHPVADEELHTALAAELAQYQALLQSVLSRHAGQPAVMGEELLNILYKLAWVFAAAGRKALATLCTCACQIAAQYWFLRQLLPAGMFQVLQELQAVLAVDALVTADVCDWQARLLQHWPQSESDSSLPIALSPEMDAGSRIVQLAAVPLLLAESFATLVQISREWFDDEGFAAKQTAVVQELALLEKGAAAMKVWPIEQLCTLLLELYAAAERGKVDLPAELLWLAHQQLVLMLDQAAAWRETRADPQLLQKLQAWLYAQNGISEPPPLEPEDGNGGTVSLHQRLLVYVKTLADAAEKPVRLHLQASTGTLDAVLLNQVEECLKPLLRFILLDNSADTWSRRAVHKPLISTLGITLQQTKGLLRISVAEDSHTPAPSARQLQHLQRRLPKVAGLLACDASISKGRIFSFTLPVD